MNLLRSEYLLVRSAGMKVSVILCSFGTETVPFLFLNFLYLFLGFYYLSHILK